jgi:quercetin dioxygenase-like cupin family protein
MSDVIDLETKAATLPAWRSTIIGQVGAANIKLINMDGRAIVEEVHDYDEAVFVVDGLLTLEFSDDSRRVEVPTGAFFMIPAGQPHSILAGCHGTLLLVDLQKHNLF